MRYNLCPTCIINHAELKKEFGNEPEMFRDQMTQFQYCPTHFLRGGLFFTDINKASEILKQLLEKN